MGDDFLKPAEVAARYGVHVKTIRRWYASGRFPVPVKVARTVRFPKKALIEFESRYRREAVPA